MINKGIRTSPKKKDAEADPSPMEARSIWIFLYLRSGTADARQVIVNICLATATVRFYSFWAVLRVREGVGSRISCYSRSISAVEVLRAIASRTLNGEDIEHNSAIWKNRGYFQLKITNHGVNSSSVTLVREGHTHAHTHTHTHTHTQAHSHRSRVTQDIISQHTFREGEG